MKVPSIKSLSRTRTAPIEVPRTMRRHDVRVLTSLPAGKMVPIASIPLLREDAVTMGDYRLTFEMSETVELLLNSVYVSVKAYLVPWLAMDRFDGMDDFNRSYEGEPRIDGGVVTPFFKTKVGEAHGANKINYHMGKHVKPGTLYNDMNNEAYNQIWNFRAANRSPDIDPRLITDTTLAPAFWLHEQFSHIVPDFDQATVDGQVPLNVVNGQLRIKGLGISNQTTSAAVTANQLVRETGQTTSRNYVRALHIGEGVTNAFLAAELEATGYIPKIFAEMEQNGITVSLSNIKLAEKTAAFAAMKKQFKGLTNEHIVDLLMDGISVPEQALQQPLLLAEEMTIFGMAKRYASDAANLTESVVNGATQIDLRIRVPRINTGGLIMIVAEITPEQLFERQKDPFLHATSVDHLPQYLRDELDPEKVVIVTNDYVDIDHDTPNDTFGYAPLNHEWTNAGACIGGRFHRPTVDASFDEDRQRIWAVEKQNPTLSADFYLCTTMHQKPFKDLILDPFEVMMRGETLIEGNTVFGNLLIEGSSADYDDVLAEAPQDRIELPA